MAVLFPKIPALLHGGDYNPDQWLDRPDILKEDIRLMKKAGINTATVGVFAWSALEPEEGEFHFEWLHRIMDELYANGIYTVLATPTGARPAWMDEKYPSVLRTEKDGRRNRHGGRHNHCMSSPAFRSQVEKMDTMLAGFALPEAVLTGPETRSSSPVRIVRDEFFQTKVNGVFPCGEGAGYAGGIISLSLIHI